MVQPVWGSNASKPRTNSSISSAVGPSVCERFFMGPLFLFPMKYFAVKCGKYSSISFFQTPWAADGNTIKVGLQSHPSEVVRAHSRQRNSTGSFSDHL